jgi:hypothetical protein
MHLLIIHRTVYEQLVKVVEVDQQALYRERAEQLENNVRLCKYKRDRQQGGSGAEALADIKDLKAGIDDLLRAKLEGVMQEARAKQAETMDKVTWLGRSIPVKNPKVRVLLIQAAELALELNVSTAASSSASAAVALAAPSSGTHPHRLTFVFVCFCRLLTLTRLLSSCVLAVSLYSCVFDLLMNSLFCWFCACIADSFYIGSSHGLV